MTALSKRIAAAHEQYRTDLAQVYMATSCIASQPYQMVCIAPPAAGKTFAFLLLAQRALEYENNNGARIVIYVSSKIVKNQIQEKLAMFDKHWAINVTTSWDPKGWIADANNKIFIIDECEDVIESNLLGLNGAGFTGLVVLRGKKVFCFTATLTDYYRHNFCSAFGVPATAIKEFHTSQFYKTGSERKQQIWVSLREKKNDAIRDLCAKVAEKAVFQPVLVFLSNDDEAAVSAIREAV